MTTEEILKDAGFSEEDIKALDPKIIAGVGKVATESASMRAAAAADKATADEEKRRMEAWFNEDVIPQINTNYSEVASAKATAEFYRLQNEGAIAQGFVPKDAPGYVPGTKTVPNNEQQPRGEGGQFVQNQEVAGSKFITKEDFYSAITNSQWAVNEYSRLYPGQTIPDDIQVLGTEAQNLRKPFRDHVSDKYKFEARRQEIQAAKQQEHDDKIRKDEREKVVKENAEKYGPNPDLRVPQGVSSFSTIRENPNVNKNPGSMNPNERRAAVRKFIQERVSQQTIQ